MLVRLTDRHSLLALLTDRYELTMLDAALRDGTAHRECVFEVFARRLPARAPLRRRRRHRPAARGASAASASAMPSSTGCAPHDVVRPSTLDWLADYRFSGTIWGYREGEAVLPELAPRSSSKRPSPRASSSRPSPSASSTTTPPSPAPPPAWSRRQTGAPSPRWARAAPASTRPSPRPAPRTSPASARPATSRPVARWGVPTMGTAAHAFTLLHDTEEDAFRAQVDALGAGDHAARRHLRHRDRRRDRRAGGRDRARRRAHRLGRPAVGRRQPCGDQLDASAPQHEDHRDQRPRRVHDRARSRAPPSTPTASAPRSSRAPAPRPPAWSTSWSPARRRRRVGVGRQEVRREGHRRRPQDRVRRIDSTRTAPRGDRLPRRRTRRRTRRRPGRARERPLLATARARRGRDPAYLGRRGHEGRTRAPRRRDAELPLEAFRLGRGEPAIPTVYT